jgi:glycosyltransferase involved in cell wall biosynthesis
LRVAVIAPHYATFIKGLTDALSHYVDSVDVFVNCNPIGDVAFTLSKYLNVPIIRHAARLSKKLLVDLSNRPKNVNIHLFNLFYLIPVRANLFLGKSLYRKLKKVGLEIIQKANLIHAHFAWPHGYATIRLGEELDIPVVVSAHGFDVYNLPFKGKHWISMLKKVYDCSSHIITVSNKNKQILIERLGISPSKISVVYNGFNEEMFKPMDRKVARETLELPAHAKIVLNVANLNPVKGHKYLIEAFAEVSEKVSNTLLVIVGDGPLRRGLELYARNLGIGDKVMFTGFRPHSEIPLWMNAADVFALSSLSEGNPTVIFEALGTGTPVVATSIGGVPEVITSSDYGILVKPGNSKELAAKIIEALEMKWDREAIRSYALKFSWKSIAKQVAEIYSNVSLKS